MATHIITLFATKEKPTPLTILDDEGHQSHTNEGDKNLTTTFLKGDTIIWKVDIYSDISSIDAITQLETRLGKIGLILPIFKSAPTLMNNGTKNWSAELRKDISFDSLIVEYTITYTVDGKQHTQDPKLQIRKPSS